MKDTGFFKSEYFMTLLVQKEHFLWWLRLCFFSLCLPEDSFSRKKRNFRVWCQVVSLDPKGQFCRANWRGEKQCGTCRIWSPDGATLTRVEFRFLCRCSGRRCLRPRLKRAAAAGPRVRHPSPSAVPAPAARYPEVGSPHPRKGHPYSGALPACPGAGPAPAACRLGVRLLPHSFPAAAARAASPSPCLAGFRCLKRRTRKIPVAWSSQKHLQLHHACHATVAGNIYKHTHTHTEWTHMRAEDRKVFAPCIWMS